MKTRVLIIAALCCALYAATAAAAEHGDYANRAAGKALIKRLHKQDGVSESTSRALLADARYQPAIVAKMRKPAEKTLTWAQYRPIFVQTKRAEQGAAYIARHRALFAAAQKKYGVPTWMIAAILGVETRYGRFTGHDRVLDALATLAFDYPERSAYFTRELEHFIKLCVAEKLDCRHDTGSYAGAMGLPQFMPSSYVDYAVDGNHDGKRDLWHETADVIDSVANYLARHGWQRGEPIARPAQVDGDMSRIQTSRHKPAYRWDALRRLGVKVANAPPFDTQVGLLALTGPHGPEYWLALPNFFVITTYNSSPLYAMAVYQLGREIKAFTPPESTP